MHSFYFLNPKCRSVVWAHLCVTAAPRRSPATGTKIKPLKPKNQWLGFRSLHLIANTNKRGWPDVSGVTEQGHWVSGSEVWAHRGEDDEQRGLVSGAQAQGGLCPDHCGSEVKCQTFLLSETNPVTWCTKMSSETWVPSLCRAKSTFVYTPVVGLDQNLEDMTFW